MEGDLLPVFPLSTVLFPRTPLPLHIFEDRYKEMIEAVLHSRSAFGVVLVRDQGIANIGCTATVEKVLKRYADGRLDIQTEGRRRFEVLMLNEEESYLQAPVHYFDDEAPGPASAELGERALQLWSTLWPATSSAEVRPPEISDPELSFQLAQFLPDLDFRQTLLSMRSEEERVRHLIQYLDEYIPRQRYTARIKSLAPRNGHGLHPPGMEEPA